MNTTMTPAQQIAYDHSVVERAFSEGKPIDSMDLFVPHAVWRRDSSPTWDWNLKDYRIAREPRTVWVLFNSDGRVLGGPAFEGRQGWTEFREVIK